MIAHGKVKEGTILFTEPVSLPDGTAVVVHIEVEKHPPFPPDAFLKLPFFAMYRDREDLEDSVAWVRKERERRWSSLSAATMLRS